MMLTLKYFLLLQFFSSLFILVSILCCILFSNDISFFMDIKQGALKRDWTLCLGMLVNGDLFLQDDWTSKLTFLFSWKICICQCLDIIFLKSWCFSKKESSLLLLRVLFLSSSHCETTAKGGRWRHQCQFSILYHNFPSTIGKFFSSLWLLSLNLGSLGSISINMISWGHG